MTAVKLAVTSDLYSPVTPLERLREVARQMAAFGADAAILAGDLGESLSDFTRCLKLFREILPCPLWVLPGDHDFWARPPYDSHRLWRELVPQTVAANNCGWLEGTAFVLGPIAVAGTVAWYDYSSAGAAGLFSDLEFAQQKYLYSADALRIDWEWSDPEFAHMVCAPFLAALDRLDQQPEVRDVVVITHFPILEQQLVRQPGQGLASAYLGNLTLGRRVLPRAKVTHILSGHTRQPRQVRLEREGLRPVDVRVVPSDYEKPAWLGLTLGG